MAQKHIDAAKASNDPSVQALVSHVEELTARVEKVEGKPAPAKKSSKK